MRNLFTRLVACLALLVGIAWCLGAWAQESPPAAPAVDDFAALCSLIIWAVQHKAWRYLVAAALMGVTWVAKKVLPDVHFFNNDRGGAILVLLLSEGGAVSTALFAHAFTWTILVEALGMGVTAAGGYTVLKRILKPTDKSSSGGGSASAGGPPPISIASAVKPAALLLLTSLALSGCGPAYAKNDAKYEADALNCAGKVNESNVEDAVSLVSDLVQKKSADAESVGEQLGLSYGLPTALCLIEKLFADFAGGPIALASNAPMVGRPDLDEKVKLVLRELHKHHEYVHGHRKHKHHK